jgi:hypothetical protein
MEIKGRIIQIMPMTSGEGRNGTWRKQEYILEIPNGNFAPKKVCFTAWTDKIDQFAIRENEELIVSIDIESREFNGKWYTDVRAWKVARGQEQSAPATAPSGQYTQEAAAPVAPSAPSSAEVDDDLPF